MLGLMIGAVLLVYLGIFFGLTTLIFRASKRKGRSTARALLNASFIAILVLAPVFWDAIPTYLAFKHYSQKEAGLKIHKTLDQWKAENPGVAESLVAYEKLPRDKRPDFYKLKDGWTRNPLNDRFAYDDKSELLLLSVRAWRYRLVDQKTNEVIAEYTEIRSGNSGGVASGGPGWWKPWLVNENRGLRATEYEEWSNFREAAKNLGGK
jgi:hypothetical protein